MKVCRLCTASASLTYHYMWLSWAFDDIDQTLFTTILPALVLRLRQFTAFTMCCLLGSQRSSRRNNRRAPRSFPKTTPKPPASLRPPISNELRNVQPNCPLFSPNFPAELRIRIYEDVLGDRHRVTHIIPFDDQSNRVGRRRCTDASCSGPTWQHKCFGTWLEDQGSSRKRTFTFYSSDQLLALPLSCHRMCV